MPKGQRIQFEAIERVNLYINEGFHPGSFIEAILCNDLKRAIDFADADHRKWLGEIALYVIQKTTGEMRGSQEIVNQWCQRRGRKGS